VANPSGESTKTVVYAKRPSAAVYMPPVLFARNTWARRQRFPDLRLIWRRYVVEAPDIDKLLTLAGAPDRRASAAVLLLAPHVTGYRLLMAMLMHPSWPISIRRALQVRNRLLAHGPIELGKEFDLVAEVSGWRILEKGIELDLRTCLLRGDETRWESIVTFYYRGSHASAPDHGEALGAPPVSPKIDDGAEPLARWRVDPVGKWAFGSLTGDYNPMHQWSWYSRLTGFRAAFAHAQRIAAGCLARLPSAGDGVRQVDLWIKGPVYFGSEVVLRQLETDSCDGRGFAVWTIDDPRPALVGRLSYRG
jgi:hypothetical protein